MNCLGYCCRRLNKVISDFLKNKGFRSLFVASDIGQVGFEPTVQAYRWDWIWEEGELFGGKNDKRSKCKSWKKNATCTIFFAMGITSKWTWGDATIHQLECRGMSCKKGVKTKWAHPENRRPYSGLLQGRKCACGRDGLRKWWWW